MIRPEKKLDDKISQKKAMFLFSCLRSLHLVFHVENDAMWHSFVLCSGGPDVILIPPLHKDAQNGKKTAKFSIFEN